AGVPRAGRPVFLKVAYHGPKAMEELAAYDPHLIPGILGGSSGTTYDAFKLLTEAKKYGARVALYGRKINNAEHQLTFVTFLRMLAEGQITAEEAVKAYHCELQKLGLKPIRPLADDSQLTTTATSYAGTGSTVVVPAGVPAAPAPAPKVEAPAAAAAVSAAASKPPSADRPKVRVTFSGSAGPTASGVKKPTFSGGGTGSVVAKTVIPNPSPAAKAGGPAGAGGKPDFSKMSSAEKVALARQRIKDDMARNNGG
ncbi:MAG TPA: hypothetical protein VF796_17180, partial [Humisphaera sp.]